MRRIMWMVILMAMASPALAANITAAPWGVTSKGEAAQIFTLKGAGGLEARISDFGGVIVELNVPDRHGDKANVMLGYDTLAQYEKGGVFGALIGRYANRVNGSQFTLHGQTYMLDHAPGAAFVIHGGPSGFQKRVWQATMHDGAEPSLELRITSPDGEGGWPGTVAVTVTYTVTRDNALTIDYRATSDKPTVMNLTSHNFLNLGGDGSGTALDHRIQLFADAYTPGDAAGIPSGQIAPVKGTPMDFTSPVRLGDVVDSSFEQIAGRKGLDHNFILRGTPGVLRPAAIVSDPASGRVLEVSTTQPGIQVYSDNTAAPVAGKNGKSYPPRASISLETQHYPDSPNRPEFPSTEVGPGKPLHEVTVFKFSAR